MWRPSRKHEGAVMITGTSSGIGEACAEYLHHLGFTVFAGVRKPDDAERLACRASERLIPVMIDVTDSDTIAAARAQVEEAVGERGLVGLVNNAGASVSGPLEFVAVEDLRWQLEVNTVGQVAVTQAFLPALRAGQGRVISVGSIGGRLALPFNGPYAASKFAMEAISDSLRRELAPWKIPVSLIEPGSVATEIWRKGLDGFEASLTDMSAESRRLYGPALTEFAAAVRATASRAIPAVEVARAVEHALTAQRPKPRYLVGRDAKAMGRAARVLPDRLADRIIERRMRAEAKRGG